MKRDDELKNLRCELIIWLTWKEFQKILLELWPLYKKY